jgi:hypothetical protein
MTTGTGSCDFTLMICWRRSRVGWLGTISPSGLQAEWQINKLKAVKRQIYGRGNLDLLQARVIKAGR